MGPDGELLDFDFHPDEDGVRVFTIPRHGVLRCDAGWLVYEVRYVEVVVRHYAFADQWFKLNLTTDLDGRLVETRSPEPGIPPFALNCDIATPLTWWAGDAVAVDLFLDVLIRGDARTYQVQDQEEFDQAVRKGLITAQEVAGARTGLASLMRLVERQRLVPLLSSVAPFGPSAAPAALPESVVPLSEVEPLATRARRAGTPKEEPVGRSGDAGGDRALRSGMAPAVRDPGGQAAGALGPVALRIDHIGSTSVPGLAAKPIIDVQISVASFEPLDAYKVPLESVGFAYRADNTERTKRYFREAPGGRRTHIHVRRAGSFSEQFALLFRDFLRTHTEDALAYAAPKRRLAAQYGHDRHGYLEARTPHIWEIIHRADGAQRVGWEPPPSDA